jgi:class 3 adenylate cyclase
MGINLGEIVADKDDIYGEGVNLAARLEGLAEPGGICISEDVYRQVRHKLSINFEYMGEKSLKNLSEDEPVYHVSFGKKRRDAAQIAVYAMLNPRRRAILFPTRKSEKTACSDRLRCSEPSGSFYS